MALLFPAAEQDTIHLNQVKAKGEAAAGTGAPYISNDASRSADTVLSCTRNSIADVTFSDSASFVKNLHIPGGDSGLIIQANRAGLKQEVMKSMLVNSLRDGQERPRRDLHDDWLIAIVVGVALLYSFIRRSSRGFQPLLKFFLFRGVNDHLKRDTGGLFVWQTTILNLVSFLIVSLFCFYSAEYFGLLPSGFSRILAWLACFGSIIILVTVRHGICALAGNLSGQREAFNQYLAGVYQTYHFAAPVMFVIVVLLSYTVIFNPGVLIFTGIGAFGLLYLLRVIRLLIIFIDRNISIFYLILYLCALEILPVAIALRYFTGHA